MGLHIKSKTKFKLLIGISAVTVSGIAALFSVTGVSSLFKGAWLTIVIMMAILEFAKIIVASYIARFWSEISKTLRVYFSGAVIILMVITSAGIFGYLSEAYQGTKGNYDVTEQETGALSRKKLNYENQIANYTKRIESLDLQSTQIRPSQSVLESLYVRKNFATIRSLDQRNKSNSDEIQLLNSKISAYIDSVSVIDNQIIVKQSTNIKGELGPLKFVADAFNTNMDTIVKYLILMLIFVFDPLAVLLFVSLSIMIRNDAVAEKDNAQNPEEELKDIVLEMHKDDTLKISKIPKIPDDIIKELKLPILQEQLKIEPAFITSSMSIIEPSMTIVNLTSSMEQPIFLPDAPVEVVEVLPEVIVENNIISASDNSTEHDFYHAEVKPIDIPTNPAQPPLVEWRTSNWKGR